MWVLESTRGDTIQFKFQRKNKNDESVIETKPDQMWFTVKENVNTKSKVIQKTLTDGSIIFSENDSFYHITIDPIETTNLAYASYPCDIQIKIGNVIKTIKKGELKITEEVTDEIE